MTSRFAFRLDPGVKRLDLPSGQPATFEKDVLRVGRWKVGDDVWNVSANTLRDLKDNYDRYRDNGGVSHVVWNHSNDARDVMGDVTDLRVENDTLFAQFAVPREEDASRVGVVNNEVSVEVQPMTDGHGVHYPQLLTHLGFVTHPVISGQGPVRRLSLLRLANDVEGNSPMADEPKKDAPGGSGDANKGANDGDSQIAVTEVVGLFKKYAGVELSSEVDTAKELRIALESAFAGKKDEAPPEPEALDAVPVDAMQPAQLRIALESERKRRLSLLAQREKEVARQLDEAKSGFTKRLSSLCESGKLAVSDMDDWNKAGEASGYRLSLLDVIDRREAGSAVPTGSKTKRLAIGANEGGGDGGSKSHEERMKASTQKVRELLGKKA